MQTDALPARTAQRWRGESRSTTMLTSCPSHQNHSGVAWTPPSGLATANTATRGCWSSSSRVNLLVADGVGAQLASDQKRGGVDAERERGHAAECDRSLRAGRGGEAGGGC